MTDDQYTGLIFTICASAFVSIVTISVVFIYLTEWMGAIMGRAVVRTMESLGGGRE